MKKNILLWAGPFVTGIISFLLFRFTSVNSLGFADGAEFALVARLGAVAHPPGFPAYVALAHAWLAGVAPAQTVGALVLLSCLLSAAAMALLASAGQQWARWLQPQSPSWKWVAAGIGAALVAASGSTIWRWSNAVEVYALHMMAFALVLDGVLRYRASGKTWGAYEMALGVALGLSNHHLTLILFLPFLVWLLRPGTWSSETSASEKSKPQKGVRTPAKPEPWADRHVLLAAGAAFLLTLFFYGWMAWRASEPYPFTFGEPDTVSRLLYHLSGGAWIKNTKQVVKGLVGMRFPYFMHLIWHQTGIFLLLMSAGAVILWKRKLRGQLLPLLGYVFLVLAYQLRIDQTSDTDAYMLLPFMVLALLTVPGWYSVQKKPWLVYALLAPCLLVHAFWNLPESDKRTYTVSQDLKAMLDASAPKNAVLLVSDWTLVSLLHYAQIVEGFRPDLVVMNYDIKFTHYGSLKVHYPEFYKRIQPEYDRYIEQLQSAHPQEVYNTGCTLDNPVLLNAFTALLQRIETVCKESGRNLMFDPKAFVFFTGQKMVGAEAQVSGCLVSRGKTEMGDAFLNLPFPFLKSPILHVDPAAGDKLVDLYAMLDFHLRYGQAVNDTLRQQRAALATAQIEEVQAHMKKAMPFLFRAQP